MHAAHSAISLPMKLTRTTLTFLMTKYVFKIMCIQLSGFIHSVLYTWTKNSLTVSAHKYVKILNDTTLKIPKTFQQKHFISKQIYRNVAPIRSYIWDWYFLALLMFHISAHIREKTTCKDTLIWCDFKIHTDKNNTDADRTQILSPGM